MLSPVASVCACKWIRGRGEWAGDWPCLHPLLSFSLARSPPPSLFSVSVLN